MRYLTKEEFLNYIKNNGIKIEDGCQGYSLSLGKTKSFSKSWVISKESVMPYLLLKILSNIDIWEKCFIWKNDGAWNYYIDDWRRPLENVWANLLHKIGISSGFKGAIEYKKSELWDLLSLLYIQISFMWCGADEFFIVFDHAQQLIFVDEDHKLHIEFANKERLKKFVTDLGE